MSALGLGVPIIEQPLLRDGTVVYTADPEAVLVGTCPLTPIEAAGREGRLIARRGLRDVMDWCGLPFDSEPTGREILDAISRTVLEPPLVVTYPEGAGMDW